MSSTEDAASIPIRVDSETEALIEALLSQEFRATGVRPEPAAVVRRAIEALRASQLGDARRAQVVAKLLEFGHELGGGEILSRDPEPNRLVLENGFAFLLAVIFDQSIRAERAWAAPLELKRRLGHLDPQRMVANSKAVADAIAARPALHRFINHVAAWVVAAADRVRKQYGGRAEAIWEGSPTAKELQRRFDEFRGIDQKKAAMAVEILERLRGVSVREMRGSDVAYDRHVRRVFLRSGLALFDNQDHILALARELNAERPGAIDFPAWKVGIQWCHPAAPDCSNCALRGPCPKLVARATTVREG